MDYSIKKSLLAFVKEHNDGSENVKNMIGELEYECYYADLGSQAVSVSDLDCLSDGNKKLLREKLGKEEGEDFTIDDCIRVAKAMDECVADEFVENLLNAINYQL